MLTLSRVSSNDSSNYVSPSTSTFNSPSVSSASSLSSSSPHLPFPSPKQYILPSSHFANEQFLCDLTGILEKGAGDLLFLCVPRADATVTREQWGSAVKEAARAMGCEIAESWTQFTTVVKGMFRVL